MGQGLMQIREALRLLAQPRAAMERMTNARLTQPTFWSCRWRCFQAVHCAAMCFAPRCNRQTLAGGRPRRIHSQASPIVRTLAEALRRILEHRPSCFQTAWRGSKRRHLQLDVPRKNCGCCTHARLSELCLRESKRKTFNRNRV